MPLVYQVIGGLVPVIRVCYLSFQGKQIWGAGNAQDIKNGFGNSGGFAVGAIRKCSINPGRYSGSTV